MEGEIRAVGQRLPLWLIAAIILLPLVLIVSLILFDYRAGFTVEADTEVVVFESTNAPYPRWYVKDANVRVDDGEVMKFSGQISVQPAVHGRVVRFDSDAAIIELRSASEAGRAMPVAILYDQAERRIAQSKRHLAIQLLAGSSVTYPIGGRIVLGDVVFSQSGAASPILRSATVSYLGDSLLRESRFRLGQTRLNAGDRFRVRLASGDTSSDARGFFRIERSGRIFVVYHARGSDGAVGRYGTDGYLIRPSLWDRFISEPLLIALATIYAPVLPILALLVLGRYARWRSERLRHSENGSGTSLD